MIQNVRHRVCFATEIMGTAIVLNPHRSHAPRQGAMLQIIHYADVKQPSKFRKTILVYFEILNRIDLRAHSWVGSWSEIERPRKV